MAEIEMLDIESNTTPTSYLTKILEFSKQSTPENSIVFDFEVDANYCHCKATRYDIDGSKQEIKEETKDVISELNKMNCKTIMLTGDNDEIAQKVATEVGLTGYKASLLPQNKVEEVEELLNSKKDKEVLCFVGDGINDAPVLMRSDIGIAMGAVGSDAAIEASDIVLMKDDLRGISVAKTIAKKTMIIVFQNIIFSIIIKVLILVLSALGLSLIHI